MAICMSLLAIHWPAFAQTNQSTQSLPDDQVVVSLITMGPGSAVYEKFGHNALWVHSRSTVYQRLNGQLLVPEDDSLFYNYGMFSFEEQNFIWRFVRGRMYYWMEPERACKSVLSYMAQDRSVWVQDLALSPQQVHTIRAILEQQTNQRYRYDYYTANCSTRIRDAIDRALGGQIKKALASRNSGVTFRYDTDRLMQYNLPLYTGLYFILGPRVDLPISAWDECYLPLRLRDCLSAINVVDSSGGVHPLVARAQELHASRRPPEHTYPPRWAPGYFLFGEHLGLAMVLLALFASRRLAARLAFAAVAGLWLLIVAFAGTFSAAVWIFTSHVAAYRNENILQFSPLTIPLIVLVPALAFGKRWGGRHTLWLAVACAGSSALGLLLKSLPWFYQDNGQMIALALPANVGLAVAVYVLSRRNIPAPATQTNQPVQGKTGKNRQDGRARR